MSRLPVSWAEAFGAALGRLAYRLGWRIQVVKSQLAESFPEHDSVWVEGTAKACYEHLGREAVAMATLPRFGLEAVRESIEWSEGREEMAESFAEGLGVVVVTGHFANWEIAGSGLAAFGYPVDAVAQRLRNRRLDSYVQNTRERLGMRLIDRASAWDRLTASLRSGRIVAFVADQDARGSGVFVPFFGRPASTHRAPALLALRAEAPLLVAGVRRVGRRRYTGWAKRLEATGDTIAERVEDLTRQWSLELERQIRLSPEQYFWHHRRWKTKPAGTGIEAGR